MKNYYFTSHSEQNRRHEGVFISRLIIPLWKLGILMQCNSEIVKRPLKCCSHLLTASENLIGKTFLISGIFWMLCMRMRLLVYANASLVYTTSDRKHRLHFTNETIIAGARHCAFSVIRLIV